MQNVFARVHVQTRAHARVSVICEQQRANITISYAIFPIMSGTRQEQKPDWYRDVNDPEDLAWKRYLDAPHVKAHMAQYGHGDVSMARLKGFANGLRLDSRDDIENESDTDERSYTGDESESDDDDGQRPNCNCKLTMFNADSDSYVCDGCRDDIPVGGSLHGCRECDFDLCDACFGQRQLNQ
jgi:hypothetical protein